jgi:hypothetical protein
MLAGGGFTGTKLGVSAWNRANVIRIMCYSGKWDTEKYTVRYFPWWRYQPRDHFPPIMFSKWRHLCILRTNFNLCTKKWKGIILHFILPCWWPKYNRNVDSKFYEYVINMSSISVVQVNNFLFSSFSGYRREWWRQYYSRRVEQSLQLCTKCKLAKKYSTAWDLHLW